MKAAKMLSVLFLSLGLNTVAHANIMQVTCTIQTVKGYYLTAVSGGGRIHDAIHSDAVRVGAWEKFKFIDSRSGSPNIQYGIRTTGSRYLTAVDGGGRITDVVHSDATILNDWEKFRAIYLGNGWYALQTVNGRYLTAVGGGGRVTDVLHTDAVNIGDWEKFRINCGM